MNAMVTRQKLIEAIRILKGVYSSRNKTKLVCMQGLRIKAENNSVSLEAVSRGIDLVRVSLAADVIQAGEVIVRGSAFRALVDAQTGVNVQLAMSGVQLFVGEHGMVDELVDPSEWPEWMPEKASADMTTMDLQWLELARMIRAVRPARCVDEHRPMLQGVCVHSEKNRGKKVFALASDGRRAHVQWMITDRRQECSIVLSADVSGMLLKLPFEEATVRISASDAEPGKTHTHLNMMWRFPESGMRVDMQVHRVDGTYPNVLRVIPQNTQLDEHTVFTCSAEELRRAAQAVLSVGRHSYYTEDRDHLKLASPRADGVMLQVKGTARDVCLTRYVSSRLSRGLGCSCVMNAGFLVDALTGLRGDVEIAMHESAPMVMRHKNACRCWMPVRCI